MTNDDQANPSHTFRWPAIATPQSHLLTKKMSSFMQLPFTSAAFPSAEAAGRVVEFLRTYT
jgi:hypothetical protein